MFKKSAKSVMAACFLAVAGLSGCAHFGSSEPTAYYPHKSVDPRTPSSYEEPSKDWRYDMRSQRFDVPGKPYLQ